MENARRPYNVLQIQKAPKVWQARRKKTPRGNKKSCQVDPQGGRSGA